MAARRQPMALPDDMLVDIAEHVAATSLHPMKDILSLRASCHDMHRACKKRAIGRRMALEREETMKWSDQNRYHTLVDNLAAGGNPEARLVVGLTQVFANQLMQLGTERLEEAAAAGHKAAAYVLGVLHYRYNDMQEAKRYIRQVEGEGEGVIVLGCKQASSMSNRYCVSCRAHTVKVVREVTWRTAATMAPVPPPVLEDGHGCSSIGCGVPEGWSADFAIFCSEGCRIRHEYTQFFSRVSFPVN